MSEIKHTPGPWRWEVNRSHKSVKLCGGPPKRGFGRYDLTVMDFRRFGMNGAAPVFWHWDYDKFVGKPERADELAMSVEGREHHASWFADIDHPDARLIAAAPELLEALESAARWFRDYERQHRAKLTSEGNLKADTNEERAAHLEAAIAKAKGAA